MDDGGTDAARLASHEHADEAFLQHEIHVYPRMRQHCLYQPDTLQRRVAVGLVKAHTEQLGTIPPRHTHEFVNTARVEFEVRRDIVDFAVKD